MMKIPQLFLVCCLVFQHVSASDCIIPVSNKEESLCTTISDYTGGILGQLIHPRDPKDFNPELEMARAFKQASKMLDAIPCVGGMLKQIADPLVDPPSDELRCITALGAYIEKAFDEIKKMIGELGNFIVEQALWIEFNREIKNPIDTYKSMIHQMLSNDSRAARGIVPLFKKKCLSDAENPLELASKFYSNLARNCNHSPKILSKFSSIVDSLFKCISKSTTNENLNINTTKTKNLENEIRAIFFNLKTSNNAEQLKDEICSQIETTYFDSYNDGLNFSIEFLKNNDYEGGTCLTYFVYINNKHKFLNRADYSRIVSDTMAEIQFITLMCLNISQNNSDTVYAINQNIQNALNETITFVQNYIFEPEYEAYDQFNAYLDNLDISPSLGCKLPYLSDELLKNALQYFASDVQLTFAITATLSSGAYLFCKKPACFVRTNIKTNCYVGGATGYATMIFNLYRGGEKVIPPNVTELLYDDRPTRLKIIRNNIETQGSIQQLTSNLYSHFQENHIGDVFETIVATKTYQEDYYLNDTPMPVQYIYWDELVLDGNYVFITYTIP